MDASGGQKTVTLQTAYVNQVVTIVKIDSSSNAVVLDAGSGRTINGAQTFTGMDAQWDSVTVQNHSLTTWYIINRYIQ
jgi:hypothetical protein